MYVILLSVSALSAASEVPAISLSSANREVVPRYGLLEIVANVSAAYDNPFDPEDIDVCAVFVPPTGETVRVNGFYALDCSRRFEDGHETIAPSGEPSWRIRFSPGVEGGWRYRLYVKDKMGEGQSEESAFSVTSSPDKGFLGRNGQTPHLFAFGDGTPFLAIGENMCWSTGPRGTFDFDDWLGALAKAGGNWIRFWMFRWNCGLEWSAEDQRSWDVGKFGGLGRYNLCNAWKLDTILDTAAANGVYVMLCLGTYGEFITGGYFNEGMWATNPYNAAMGGPCSTPEEFWTNETARRVYRQRLRYIAARYGWRTNLFAWEFWNEAQAPAVWVGEMAQCLKGQGPFAGAPADPFGHMVSTTYGNPEVWNLPEVDFTMTHHYGEANLPDHAPVIHDDALSSAVFGKPHLMAEFGIDWRSSDDKQDTEFKGVNLHNGLWSSVFSGNAGTAMIWYWDGYVHPGNLYRQFTPLRGFVDRVPWNAGAWTPLDVDRPQLEIDPDRWRDLTLAPNAPWGKNEIAEFDIAPLEGSRGKPLPTFLYGSSKADLQTPLALKVHCERPGRFELRVNTVSIAIRIQFLLDGTLACEVPLDASPVPEGGQAEYQSTEFRQEYGVYQARFDKSYGIDLPEGDHSVVVNVVEGDWLSIGQYVFANYTSERYANLQVSGMRSDAAAILWAHNADHHWLNVRDNKPIAPVAASKTVLRGLSPGTYACTWWDPWNSGVLIEETLESADGLLRLSLAEIEKDIALLAVRRE